MGYCASPDQSKYLQAKASGLQYYGNAILNTRIDFRRIVLTLLLVYYIFDRVFASRYSINLGLPWWTASACAFLFAAVALAGRHAEGSERAIRSALFGRYTAVFILPWVVFAGLSVLWMIQGTAGYYYPTRPVMELIKLIGIGLIVYGLGVEYGADAADKLFKTMVAMYFLSFLYGLACEGLSGFVSYLVDNSANVRQYYEVHDICLAIPMFIYYYWQMNIEAPHRKLKIAVAVFISLAGFKRIALAAAAVILILAFLIRIREMRGIRFTEVIIQCFLCAFGIFWIVFTGTGLIENVAAEYGINMMSRDVIYSFMQQYASFDFWQSIAGGKGLEFCNYRLLLASGVELHNMTITALHNDLLKLDIEMGLAGYLLWLAYTIFLVPAYLRSNFGPKAKTAYVLLTVFVFIVYATDNTTTYPVFQMVLFCILACATFAELTTSEAGGCDFVSRRLGRRGNVSSHIGVK